MKFPPVEITDEQWAILQGVVTYRKDDGSLSTPTPMEWSSWMKRQLLSQIRLSAERAASEEARKIEQATLAQLKQKLSDIGIE